MWGSRHIAQLLGLVLLCLTTAQCNFPWDSPPPPIPETGPPTPAFNDPPQDLLDVVLQRGYLKVGVRVWPDAVFQPPLYRLPIGGLDGFEVDLAWALADHLGVELEMAERDPRQLGSGDWGGEWDLALAWMPITDQARQNLIFSHPYAYDVGRIAIPADEPASTQFEMLTGRRLGVPAITIYQQLLNGQTLSVQGQAITLPIPPNLQVKPYNRDGNALRDLTQPTRELEAVLHSQIVLEAALAAELPLRLLPEPRIILPIGIAFDRHGMPPERLHRQVNEALAQLRETNQLSDFALDRYTWDITVIP